MADLQALLTMVRSAWSSRIIFHNSGGACLCRSATTCVGIDSAILMNPRVWEASGHVGGFHDPLVADMKTKKRYRADHLLEENGVDPTGMSLAQMGEVIVERGIKSPEGNALSAPQQFNMMFKTSVGSVDGSDTTVYLRPETAQGMFVNFKNIIDSYHPKLPFGIAQIGRNFQQRNCAA